MLPKVKPIDAKNNILSKIHNFITIVAFNNDNVQEKLLLVSLKIFNFFFKFKIFEMSKFSYFERERSRF